MSDQIPADDIFKTPAPRLFTIEPGRPFLLDLATALHQAITKIPDTDIADTVIYVPTRRAIRALADAFVEAAPNNSASLLPRICALGDIDETEFIAFAGPASDEIDLPPAVSSVARRITLARLIAARDKCFHGSEHWAGALAGADALGRLLDSFYTEQIAPRALSSIVPDGLAAHWHHSIDFLEIILDAWPKHLADANLMDPAERRVKLIERQTANWQSSPPGRPIIIAGTTGSTPAVTQMIKCVAALPLGLAVLPGLDLISENRIWDKIDEPHPQSGLKHLLTNLKIERDAIRRWPRSTGPENDRNKILSVILRPAEASDSWRDWAVSAAEEPKRLEEALENVELVEAADEESEAVAIALKIRGEIEKTNHRIFLVTPDRDLARRVAMTLWRWKIEIDDSAGVPFANTPCGGFLRLVADWLCDASDPVALLSMLRHPLFGGSFDERSRSRLVNQLDLALRGLRPHGGIEGLLHKVQQSRFAEAARPLLERLQQVAEINPPPAAIFEERFRAHLDIAEALAATSDQAGAARLWRGDDGEAGAIALAGLRDAAVAIGNAPPDDYPEIFRQLISDSTVRQNRSSHPRIAILGPLEARLQQADLVILGGLNEGVWPNGAAIDPFLSRSMRQTLGLPSPERRIGLAAHDFAQLASAPAVMLTRSTRAGGKPTTPSRWIVRLKNILNGAGALHLIEQSDLFADLQRRLDAPGAPERASPPGPRPPLDSRPHKFFVTRIEKLLRDPYSIYARDILKLKKLDEPSEAFGPRESGILFHQIFEDYVRTGPPPTDEEGMERLQALFDKHATQFGLTGIHRPFWEIRARDAFQWFIEWDMARRHDSTPSVVEGAGIWRLNLNGADFEIGAKADRIDRRNDGALLIVDYKTGKPPSLSQVGTFSPQLPLTGLIAMNGGFETVGAAPIAGFEYIRVINRKNPTQDTVSATGKQATDQITAAEHGLKKLLTYFNDPQTPYHSQPRPQYQDQYSDYDHLARRRERRAHGSDE